MKGSDSHAAGRAASVRPDARTALDLHELLELLVREKLLTPEGGTDVEARSTTLRSRVLKERVGSVRSQAAARYDVSPAEIVTVLVGSFCTPTRIRSASMRAASRSAPGSTTRNSSPPQRATMS